MSTIAKKENLQRYHADLQLLIQKTADYQALKTGAQKPASPFVQGLRGAVENEAPAEGTVEDKVTILESVLSKVVELDRLILGITAPEDTKKPARRASRGMDLFTIPTHMHVVDRLMDLHTKSKRITVIREGDKDKENSSTSGPAPPVHKKGNEERALEPVPPLVPPGAMAIGGVPSTKSPRPNPKLDNTLKELKEEVRNLKAQLGEHDKVAKQAAASAAKSHKDR